VNILQANKFFYPRGGAETVLFETIEGLKKRDHHVVEFSMHHPRNKPSLYSDYFISQIPELLGPHSPAIAWKTFVRLFYSGEVTKKLTRLIKNEAIQVAHLHNIYHHLSASTFTVLRKHKIPTVLTLHDVFPLCPNHSLLRGETLDEAAYKGKTYNCLRYRCIDNQFLPSLAGTLEAYFYRIRRIWDNIDLFICPSQFMKDKMIEWGFPAHKLQVVHNPFPVPTSAPELPLGEKVVFLGRIHYEKGIKLLLKAAKMLPTTPFLIVGTGPDEQWVDTFIQQHNLTNVERMGFVQHGTEGYLDVLRQAKVVVTPSLFYENCSMTILETMFYKRLPVAVHRGGSPEMVIEGQTGFLAAPEDPRDLARAISTAMNTSPEAAERLTAAGHALVQQHYAPKDYIDAVEKIYEKCIK
jgi:glycosyltransferase involved in cell wall biosynthesis